MFPHNTRTMPLDPEPPEPFHELDARTGRAPLTFLPVMTGDKFRELVAYPVIVEGWEKAKHGRHRRAFLSEFKPAERAKIGRYYGRFYRWYLVTGTPRRVVCRIATLRLLQRAAAFFANV